MLLIELLTWLGAGVLLGVLDVVLLGAKERNVVITMGGAAGVLGGILTAMITGRSLASASYDLQSLVGAVVLAFMALALDKNFEAPPRTTP